MEEGDPVWNCSPLSRALGWHSAAEGAFAVWTVSPPPLGGEGWQTGWMHPSGWLQLMEHCCRPPWYTWHPALFPTPSRKKSGTLIQLLRQVRTKILRYQMEKCRALAISLDPFQGQFPSCTAIVGSKLGEPPYCDMETGEMWVFCSSPGPCFMVCYNKLYFLKQWPEAEFCFRIIFVFALVIHFQF